MDHAPESPATNILLWIAYERDAAWTTKLSILRAGAREDIVHLGACLREHERHADELAILARMADRTVEVQREPSFVTAEPFVVGAIDDGLTLLDAVERLVAVRIDRYQSRPPTRSDEPSSTLNGLLDRHLSDARARLERLRGLRELRRDAAA